MCMPLLMLALTMDLTMAPILYRYDNKILLFTVILIACISVKVGLKTEEGFFLLPPPHLWESTALNYLTKLIIFLNNDQISFPSFSCHCSLIFFCAWLKMSLNQTLSAVKEVAHMAAVLGWEQSAALKMR